MNPNDITAFPVTPTNRGGQCAPTQYGMTLRDYFAGQALAGICADPNMPTVEKTAELAYRMADAMLAARGGR